MEKELKQLNDKIRLKSQYEKKMGRSASVERLSKRTDKTNSNNW